MICYFSFPRKMIRGGEGIIFLNNQRKLVSHWIYWCLSSWESKSRRWQKPDLMIHTHNMVQRKTSNVMEKPKHSNLTMYTSTTLRPTCCPYNLYWRAFGDTCIKIITYHCDNCCKEHNCCYTMWQCIDVVIMRLDVTSSLGPRVQVWYRQQYCRPPRQAQCTVYCRNVAPV